MADPSRRNDALLTDHFTYTPLSLIDDIINAVNTIIYQALDAIEDGLLNVPPAQLGFKPGKEAPEPTEAARDEIENGVHQLETLLESTVDKSFDKFEIYTLRSILTVPEDLAKWIRLGHYEGLNLPLQESAPTPESLHRLRRQLQETRKLNLALKAKHARNAAMIQQLKSMLSPPTSNSIQPSKSLAFLTQAQTSNSSQTPITTQTQFATSQLPALRRLMGELRPKLDELKSHDPRDVPRDSRKEERRQYIESGVRRVVSRRGLDGGEGDLKAMNGERRDREEVEMLEGIVKGMGQEDRLDT